MVWKDVGRQIGIQIHGHEVRVTLGMAYIGISSSALPCPPQAINYFAPVSSRFLMILQ